MIRNEDNPENSVLPFLISPLTEARGQVQFCQNLIAILFEKWQSPCTKKFPDVKIKRQLLDHYRKGICSLKSQYEIYTIEIKSPNAFHDRYLVQTIRTIRLCLGPWVLVYQESIISIPTDISSQAISTISINKDYVRVYPLTVGATSWNYMSFFPERTGNISLNSTFKNKNNLNGTRNLTQQDIQTPSHFVSEKIVDSITKTEAQRSISPIQPNFTTPRLKNPTLQQTIIQSTVKTSVT